MSSSRTRKPYKAVDGREYEPDFSLDDPYKRKIIFNFALRQAK